MLLSDIEPISTMPFAVLFNPVKTAAKLTTSEGRGTVAWASPEILSLGEYDEMTDVYSYGVVVWEIASRKIPYDSLDSVQVLMMKPSLFP